MGGWCNSQNTCFWGVFPNFARLSTVLHRLSTVDSACEMFHTPYIWGIFPLPLQMSQVGIRVIQEIAHQVDMF